MNPSSNGVFSEQARVALVEVGCEPTEIWALGIFAEQFCERGKAHLVQTFILGMGNGASFKRVLDQCEQTWSDTWQFTPPRKIGDIEDQTWGVVNAWAFQETRRRLGIKVS